MCAMVSAPTRDLQSEARGQREPVAIAGAWNSRHWRRCALGRRSVRDCSGILSYGAHSVHLHADLLPVLIDARRYVIELATAE